MAGELAGWQELHERMGRKAIKELARGVLVIEKGKLEGMMRAMRRLKLEPAVLPAPEPETESELLPGPKLDDGVIDGEVEFNGGPA